MVRFIVGHSYAPYLNISEATPSLRDQIQTRSTLPEKFVYIKKYLPRYFCLFRPWNTLYWRIYQKISQTRRYRNVNVVQFRLELLGSGSVHSGQSIHSDLVVYLCLNEAGGEIIQTWRSKFEELTCITWGWDRPDPARPLHRHKKIIWRRLKYRHFSIFFTKITKNKILIISRPPALFRLSFLDDPQIYRSN